MPTTARWSLSLPVRHPSVAHSSASCSADGQRVPQDIPKCHCRTSPTVTLVRNGPLNTACRTLIEESSGCEDDQAALQGAENRSCLAQVMRSGTVGLVLQCYLYIGYEATASSPELEHFHYALPETFFAPLAVATVYRSPRPELLFR